MPIQRCTLNNKPGFKWGERGKCYTYDQNDAASRERAKQRALRQGRAIERERKIAEQSNNGE